MNDYDYQHLKDFQSLSWWEADENAEKCFWSNFIKIFFCSIERLSKSVNLWTNVYVHKELLIHFYLCILHIQFVYALEHLETEGKKKTFSYFCHLTLTSGTSMKRMKMMRISSWFHHSFLLFLLWIHFVFFELSKRERNNYVVAKARIKYSDWWKWKWRKPIIKKIVWSEVVWMFKS